MLTENFQFLSSIPDTSLLYLANYNVFLVLLSIGIATFASYTALQVSQLASQTDNKYQQLDSSGYWRVHSWGWCLGYAFYWYAWLLNFLWY